MEVCEKFIINNTNRASQFFFDGGIPEQSLIEWSKQFVNDYQNFVDIGSHVGTYALGLADYCYNAYAFEASRFTYYQLCGSISLHEQYNVFPHNIALSDKTTDNRILWHTTHDGGGSTFAKPLESRIIGNEFVKTRTLDSYNLDNISLIKIDVEGHELAVLKGAVETIQMSNYPKILFESNYNDNNRKELFEFLTDMDYKIHPITGYSNMFLASI